MLEKGLLPDYFFIPFVSLLINFGALKARYISQPRMKSWVRRCVLLYECCKHGIPECQGHGILDMSGANIIWLTLSNAMPLALWYAVLTALV